ncbi:MAG: PAS domain S-box protein [Verrucomicrobia bacterium]|nr:PAS domain S-box protein [Verrucomicrobiota bacterium]
MPRPLRVLILEDNPADAELVLHELRRADYEPRWERVESEPDFLAHLDPPPEIILSDYQMPQFTAVRALELLRGRPVDVPFVIVSGTIGEDVAVEAMRAGATDYLLKDRLARLGLAVARALEGKKLREEKRRADQALRDSEGFLEQAQEVAHIGSWISDLAPEAPLVWSREVFHIFGLSETEFDGTVASFLARVHPDDLEAVRQASRLATERSTDYEIEHRIIRPDGDVRWVHEKARVLRDAGGRPVRMLGVVQDITERKAAEALLAEERNLLRTLINTHPDFIYVKDTASRFVIANRAIVRSFGKALPEEIVGKSDQDFHPPDRAAQFQADEQKVLQTGQPLIDREDFVLSPDGETRCVLSTKVPLRDENGQIVGLVGIGHDLTERKRAEARLQLFRQLVDQSNDAIFVLEAETSRLLDVNETACRQLGYRHDELLNLRVTDLNVNLATPAAWAERLQVLRATGSRASESLVRCKDGSTFPIEAAARYLVLDQKEYVIAVVRDITERKRAETALLRQNEELVRFNRVAVGRELRMIELKQQVNDLARQLGQPAPYPLAFLDATAAASLPSANASTVGGQSEPASTPSP